MQSVRSRIWRRVAVFISYDDNNYTTVTSAIPDVKNLGYIIVPRPPSSCERHKSHSIQPIHGQGYILIFLDRMHLLFTQVHFQFWQLDRVGGQYATGILVVYPCHILLFYSFESFSLQGSQMVSHWSLSESKSPQVSRTFLSILADLKNATVWMVSTCPLFSNFPVPLPIPWGTVPSAQTTIDITVTFMFHIFYLFLYPSFHFLLFSLCCSPGRQSPLFGRFSFFVDYHSVWSSGRD